MYDVNNDIEHYQRINKYSHEIRLVYLKAIREVVNEAVGLGIDPSKPFSFSDHPRLEKKVRAIMNSMADDIRIKIIKAIELEWDQGNKVNDALVERVFKFSKLGKVPYVFLQRNLDARDAFINRRTGAEGLNLSQKIWNYAGQFRQELEMALDLGLADGRSAQALSRDVRKYLNEPDRLFRRVRDKHGKLHLSKNAQAYHPGQGKYRSSYKNAMRLTRTEINMAYRQADHVRANQLPFIVGVEIKLSNNPDRVEDICDHLVGLYPKDFVFLGWHPQCMCQKYHVLPTDEEFRKMQMEYLKSGNIKINSSRTVKVVPDGFKKWMKDHKESYARARERDTLPYFVRDNQKYVEI